uniref:Uncharacterized protein n=1 Tax=Molossus molossus TaxID=27622 RepID=A0A7J8F991_MOLMO|nr:hypothetical protein HJG59_008598 [Molossus molossus]
MWSLTLLAWPGAVGSPALPPSLPERHPHKPGGNLSTVLVCSLFLSYPTNSLPNGLYSQLPLCPESHPSLHPHCLGPGLTAPQPPPQSPGLLLPSPLYHPRSRPWWFHCPALSFSPFLCHVPSQAQAAHRGTQGPVVAGHAQHF